MFPAEPDSIGDLLQKNETDFIYRRWHVAIGLGFTTVDPRTYNTKADKSIQILHVDDEPDFAELTASFLEQNDERLTVRSATSAAKGEALLADYDVEGVISDYEMPDQNGIEFLILTDIST